MSSHRITHTAGLALSIAALAAPSALASPQNLVSPDAQDAAVGRGTFSAPEVTVVKVPEAGATDNGSGGGIQWTDAGIGAGGMLGIIALAGGTAALITHRPRRRTPAAQPTAR